MTARPDFEFRTAHACKYDDNNPRCGEVATNVPGAVAVRNRRHRRVHHRGMNRLPHRCQAGRVRPVRLKRSQRCPSAGRGTRCAALRVLDESRHLNR